MSEDIASRVQSLFRRVLNQPSLVLTRELTAGDVRGWDSLKHVELIVSLEGEFGIRFKTAEVGALNNVGELLDKVAAKVAAKK
jgi:acyl carrier protein